MKQRSNKTLRKRDAEYLLSAARQLRDLGRASSELPLVQRAAEEDDSSRVLKALFFAAMRDGSLDVAERTLEEIKDKYGKNPVNAKWLEKSRDQLAQRKVNAYELLKAVQVPKQRRDAHLAKRICYVLHNCLPYASGGYATRAHGLVQGFKTLGYDVICISRPGFPIDLAGFEGRDIPDWNDIEGTQYHHITSINRKMFSGQKYIAASADILEEKFSELRPEIVIAASNYLTALPSLIAARRLGIPFAYEIRGFWEVTRLSREPSFVTTGQYRQIVDLETVTATNSDHVFTLTEPMREEITARGTPSEMVTLLPNSCDPSRFIPRRRDQNLAARLGIPDDTPVIGYIGSFVQYEGLEHLAQACAILAQRGKDFRLLLVGNENVSGTDRGPITEEIQRVANEEGLADKLIMPGRIPHEEVAAHYSLIDIAPFPRKPQPVTEMVSPMKPLEAFAMEKVVIASSVRALMEMVTHEETGLIFEKGDVQALADTLDRLISDPSLRDRLGKAGRAWVEQERTWERTAQKALSDLQGKGLLALQADEQNCLKIAEVGT